VVIDPERQREPGEAYIIRFGRRSAATCVTSPAMRTSASRESRPAQFAYVWVGEARTFAALAADCAPGRDVIGPQLEW
jgi:hypothetical protein